MTRSTGSSVSRYLSIALLLSVTATVATARVARAETVALGDGVLVDAARGVAYLMNPEMRIDAVELGTGARLWTSAVAAKPLAVAGDVLVAQAESEASGRLDVVSFDVRDGRAGRLQARVDLPEGVRARLYDDLEGSFRVHAVAQERRVVLSWSGTKTAAGLDQGYLPSDSENQAPSLNASRTATAAVDKRARRLEGTVQVDLESGRVSAPTKTFARPRPLDVLTDGRIRGKGRQFSSADARHALASERVAGADVWHGYRWTIYDLESGRQLGALSHHASSAPFVVAGDRLVYVSGRFLRRQGNDIVDEPRQLRVVDLASGAELMALTTGEPDFQGPFPP